MRENPEFCLPHQRGCERTPNSVYLIKEDERGTGEVEALLLLPCLPPILLLLPLLHLRLNLSLFLPLPLPPASFLLFPGAVRQRWLTSGLLEQVGEECGFRFG